MTTEPTDLREKIEAALRAHRPTIVDVCPVEGSVIEVLVSARIDDVIDAVEAIVREAQGEAWDDCSDTAGDYLAGGSVRAAMALAEMNPYRDERSTDDGR